MTVDSEHIEGRCPECNTKWRLRTSAAGHRVRCKQCRKVFFADPPTEQAADGPPAIPGYKIKKELGRGGMGRVYLARQLATKRNVALKVMLAGRHADERQRRRFEREVEIAAGLQHPHIARIYASGLHEDRHWFAMEYVEGVPLDKYVEQGQLGLRDMLALFARICHAVSHAHQRGIIHRDLKPANILVDSQAQPRILDFGLAKQMDRLMDEADGLSLPGEVAGTPAYMSPEQTYGEPGRVETRSDVYSLGVILYRLLTGESPYGAGKSVAQMLRAINETEPPPPRKLRKDTPDDVNAIVMKSMEKSAAFRYQSAGEMGRDVEAYLAGEPVIAKQGAGWYTLRKTAFRYRKAGVAVAAVIVLSLTLGATMSIRFTRTKSQVNEVTREVEVLRQRESAPDPALQNALADAQAQAQQLCSELDERIGKTAEARDELAELAAQSEAGLNFNPPPPNPADPVNYIEWMNDTFSLENAADDYRRAYKQLSKFEGSDREQANLKNAIAAPWSDDEKLAVWLERCQSGLASFRAAARKSKCYFPLEDDTEESEYPRLAHLLMARQINGLPEHRAACKALLAEGWRAWADGDEERLADNIPVVLRSADHLRRNWGPLITGLVGNACSNHAYESVSNALALSDDPDTFATRLKKSLAAADPPPPDSAVRIAFEKLWNWDCVQRMYMPGKRRGAWAFYVPALMWLGGPDWLTPELANSMMQNIDEVGLEEAVRKAGLPDQWEGTAFIREVTRFGFDETMREINTYFDDLEQWCRSPIHIAPDYGDELTQRLKETKNPAVEMLVPALSRTRILYDRTVATRRATHLLVHLFAYHSEHGRFPRRLDRLEAPNIAELRIDPFTGQDFVYKRTGKSFTLYSAGHNTTDDGGKHHAKWGQGGAGGDFVFWPVQSIEKDGWGFLTLDGRTVSPPRPNPAEPVNYIAWANEEMTKGLTDNAADNLLQMHVVMMRHGLQGGAPEALDGKALEGPWSGNQELSRWLERFQPVLEEFRKAARKSQCFYPWWTEFPSWYSGSAKNEPRDSDPFDLDDDPRMKGWSAGVLLPGLALARLSTKAMIAEGWQAWARGDHELLPANTLVVLRCARHHEHELWLIGKLVGVAMSHRAYNALLSALAESDNPGALATRLLAELAEADPIPPNISCHFRSEQTFCGWDASQRVFLPGQQPGSWQVYEPMYRKLVELSQQIGTPQARSVATAEIEKLAEIGFDETMNEINRHFGEMVAWCETPYHAAPHRGEEIERAIPNSDNPLIRRLLPSLIRARLLCERRKANRRATHLIYHLFAHREKKGGFPTALRWLDAPDLAEIRIDPFSGKDFKYTRSGDSFTLYSVADNLKDDRGRHDSKWKNGDFVFWPVQE